MAVRCVLVVVAALCATVMPRSAAAADTMRVDFTHSGDSAHETFAINQIVIEPTPWPGNPARPIDGSNRGKYFFEVQDAATSRVLFSRGFSSIFGEWETIAEAKTTTSSFAESLRFPAVASPARIVVRKRDAANVFRDIWTFAIDPSADAIEREQLDPAVGPVIAIHRSGNPAEKLDLVLVGDGYKADERSKFEQDARRLTQILLQTSPFRERQSDINVWAIAASVGATYNALGLERYMLTFENQRLREVAAHAPYDAIEIVANSAAYGGGGIQGLYSVVAVDNVLAPYLFIHEFGHQIAGLADEYYSSDVVYLPDAAHVEPWEPNVTTVADRTRIKWADLIDADVPVPTPWPDDRYIGRVGAFEGANYQKTGYFRPEPDCIMFSRSASRFCRVCQRAIRESLDLLTSH